MKGVDTEPKSIDLDAWRLLPWLANGTLEGDELDGVLDHLKHSPQCREELLFLSELRHAVEAGVADRLDVPEQRLADLIDRIEVHERRQRPNVGGGVAASRWLAQAALLLLLAGALWWSVGAGDSREDSGRSTQFRTLSADASPSDERPDTRAAEGEAPRLRLIPEAGLSEADLRRLVLDLDAEIVAGPTPLGAYTLGWKAGRVPKPPGWLDEVAAGLRSDTRVALAEPIRGP